MASSGTALSGLKVVDFSNVRPGCQASQFFADFGAEVIHVETPGGSPLRDDPAWPFLARGKKSVQLDLKAPTDLETARRLTLDADVVIETFRPGVADRLGLGYQALSHDNPRLVYGSVTGFGPHGPCADLQGYEGTVMAKMGVCWHVSPLTGAEEPAMLSPVACSYPAAQLLNQAILAALYERESSGVGQRVQTSLAQALTVYDTFNWFSRVVAQKFQGGVQQVARVVGGIPTGTMSFRLLIAMTKDGRWLQFSQTAPRLYMAMMELFGLEWMFDSPDWPNFPEIEDDQKRLEFWETLLGIVRSKTAAEWREAFDRAPNVWGEEFRVGSELLDHPQMQWNGMVAHVTDAERGPVRQPARLVKVHGLNAGLESAPRLGQHDAEIRSRAASASAKPAAPPAAPSGKLPLEGVTVVELGTYYAAPYAATLLAELGAKVIKLEQLDGDPHRFMMPFPEVAGLKVLQGKLCVAVDVQTPKGREIAHQVIARSDMVLQSFRAGVAKRLGLDAETLQGVNPDLIYLSSPGYGEGGPCGGRPAFAPTIGAGAGWAARNATRLLEVDTSLTMQQVRQRAMQLSTAVMGVANCDGLSAASSATAMLMGLYARTRGGGGQAMLTTMLSSTAHALAEVMVEYEGRPDAPITDEAYKGWAALYRLYPTAEEWVFLAAPSEREWARLTGALPGGGALAADARFATAEARKANDAALVEALGAIFLTRTAGEWERLLRAADVACVEAARGPVDANYLDEGSVGRLSGYVTRARHPILDEVPRLKALVEFSRSATTAGDAGLVGQHTREVLADFGYSDADMAALAEEKVILLG